MLTYNVLITCAGMLAAVAPAMVFIADPSNNKTSPRVWVFMTLALAANIGVIALVAYADYQDEKNYVRQSVVRTIGIMAKACP